jgi:hypothetical protein
MVKSGSLVLNGKGIGEGTWPSFEPSQWLQILLENYESFQ